MKTKVWKRIATAVLAGILLLGTVVPAYADSEDKVIALGANLNSDERATVLSLLGLTEEEVAGSTVITVTNDEEKEYLGSYLPASVIGSRALSSCVVYRASEGDGISVETHNITYCTAEMYQNALATAGVKNAKIVVAAPFNISGTAALVGAIKAYAEQEGILIKPENIDVANNEIVTTSEVAQSVGDPDKVAQLIAAVKEIVADQNLTDEEAIGKIIDEISVKLEISLTEKDRQLIIDLMMKISKLDIDIQSLREQAGDVYKELKNAGIDLSEYGITEEEVNSFLQFFINIWEAIVNFFKGGK